MKIPTAVVGLGKIGLTYDIDELGQVKANQVMTHCRSIYISDFFQLEYLIDPNPDAVQRAVALYGGNGYQSLADALNEESPKLLILSVPTDLHLDTLLFISEKWQPSIYLIEKPFGKNSEEARKMARVLQNQNTKVFVNYMRRYLPNFASLKSSALFKNRGELQSVKIDGYGTLRNIFSHFFDLLLFLETSRSLGLSKKEPILSELGSLIFRDPLTGVHYELNGVGESLRNCEMTIAYDYMTIHVTSNGRCIEVRDLHQNSLEHFDIEETSFKSYQSAVLKEIGMDYGSVEPTSCVEDAILIHEFIESI